MGTLVEGIHSLRMLKLVARSGDSSLETCYWPGSEFAALRLFSQLRLVRFLEEHWVQHSLWEYSDIIWFYFRNGEESLRNIEHSVQFVSVRQSITTAKWVDKGSAWQVTESLSYLVFFCTLRRPTVSGPTQYLMCVVPCMDIGRMREVQYHDMSVRFTKSIFPVPWIQIGFLPYLVHIWSCSLDSCGVVPTILTRVNARPLPRSTWG